MSTFPQEKQPDCDALRQKLFSNFPATWRERISVVMPRAKLSSPATEVAIDALEKELAVHFPPELRALLLETNGIDGLYSEPLCSVTRISEMNRYYRTNEIFSDRMPFENLLFFGDTGNGDDFAFPINRDGSVSEVIFLWDHETDSREEYANGLNEFLIRYAVQFYSLSAKAQKP